MSENTERQGSFGWRYFHFIEPSGRRINIVEHKTDIFGLENKPYMTMITKEPYRKPLRFKGEPNLVWERGDSDTTRKFEFVFDNARFNGEITEILEHRELKDVVLFEDKMGRKSHWTVGIPYGKIAGEIQTPQGKNGINGYVYQDQQWGDVLIQEWVKNWTWSHLANENLFVVIFCINTVDNQKSWHSIYGRGRDISVDQNFEVPHLAKLEKSGNLQNELTRAEIKIPGKLSAAFALIPNNIMRLRIQENHLGFSASYIRWSVDAITYPSNKTAQGIAEYMAIQKL